MRWSADGYLESLYQKRLPAYHFQSQTKEAWEVWRNALKEVLIRDMGGFPTEFPDLNPRVIEEKSLDTHTRQRVVYATDENLDVPAYVLIPKGARGKLPAIVACHGHGYGSREIVGLHPDGSENRGDAGYQKNFALELVEKGYLVIVPELFGFGDRRLEEDVDKPLGQSACHRIATYLFMMGKTLAGTRVWDTLRTIDYLQGRRDVDADRIGCMGISGGGLVCAFSSAVDERIRVSVVSGYANTFKDSVMSLHHCVDNFVPGLVNHAEMHDIIGLVAPRPLLIESGTADPIFPIRTARKAYSKVGDIYDLLHSRDKLDMDVFEGAHQIWGVKAYEWFHKWL